MKTLIFVGGATACGKSTLVKSLNEKIPNSICYRRHQAFFDIALEKGIAKNDIYKKINSEEVDDWFVNVCDNASIIISDVHYAVQLDRNDIDTSNEIDIYQNYVSTISNDLLNKIISRDIHIIAIYLSCSPETRIKRAIARYNKSNKIVRNISIEDADMESKAEESVWSDIVTTGIVDGIKMDSESFSVEELTIQCLDYLKKNEEITLKKEKHNK